MKSKRGKNHDDWLSISEEIYRTVNAGIGRFFADISRIDSEKITGDMLDPEKADCQADVLQRFTSLRGKKVLEVGSGLGNNIGVWIRKYTVDGYGIEPSGDGFDNSLEISRKIFEENKLDPKRLLNGCGEDIPFPENTFDVVFSANVLEHTQSPSTVLEECVRVLKPGGILQIVFPNYHSFFDGHYAVFHPPVFASWVFPFYIRYVLRRDSFFAGTLNTQLNVSWVRSTLKKIRSRYQISLLSLGDEIFRERMSSIDFSDWAGVYKVKKIVFMARKMQLDKIVAKMLTVLNAWTPIILTLRKN